MLCCRAGAACESIEKALVVVLLLCVTGNPRELSSWTRQFFLWYIPFGRNRVLSAYYSDVREDIFVSEQEPRVHMIDFQHAATMIVLRM